MALNNTSREKEFAAEVISKVNLVSSQEEATALLQNFYQKSRPVVLSFINAHAYNLCCTNAGFSKALLASDIILRDGIGMEILYSSIGIDPKANLNGTDYIPILLDRFKGKKVALLGTEAPYLKKAADKLSAEGHKIVLTETGFCSPDHYLTLIQHTNPDVIVLGMGMPKQEMLSVMFREKIKNRCLIINGGAILDFWGNKMYRAPMWLRRLKMEWLFRLLQEPGRLCSRYLIGNFIFLCRVRDLKKYLVQQSRPLEEQFQKNFFEVSIKRANSSEKI